MKSEIAGTRNSVSTCDQVDGSAIPAAGAKKSMRVIGRLFPQWLFSSRKSMPAEIQAQFSRSACFHAYLSYSNQGKRHALLSAAEKLVGGVHRAGDVLLIVRRRKKTCLKLRGREIDSPIEHPMEECLKASRIGTLGRLPIDTGSGREKKVNIEPARFTVIPFEHSQSVAPRVAQRSRIPRMRFQITQHAIRRSPPSDCRKASRPDRSSQGATLFINRAPTVGASGRPPPRSFERREIRLDFEEFLCAAG